MKLLLITQKVDGDDDVLGFMNGWIAEFAKHCERLTVVCLGMGHFQFRSNVKVLSLGKEVGSSKIKYILNFFQYIWRERKNYDCVFIHMNPEYVVLGGLFWRLWGKKIALWYAHGHVNFVLLLAEKICQVIFTSTKEGCRIKSKKIKVVGQGIDTEKFGIKNLELKNADKNSELKIISVGRISPSKDYETLINAVSILLADGYNLKAKIIGAPAMPKDAQYFEKLKKVIKERRLNDTINFVGSVPNKNLAEFLQEADLFVNLSHTGSLDKTGLEAMACGLPVITCNEAYRDLLKKYTQYLIFSKKDSGALAEKISFFYSLSSDKQEKISVDLRKIIVENHNIDNLIVRMLKIIRDGN